MTYGVILCAGWHKCCLCLRTTCYNNTRCCVYYQQWSIDSTGNSSPSIAVFKIRSETCRTDRSTILPKFIYDKEGKLAGLTQILPVNVHGPALILKTAIAAYMRWWIGSALVQIMACRLDGTKPLSEPMLSYCQLHPEEYISMNFYLKFKYFHSWKCIWTCRLQNGSHFVQGKWVNDWGRSMHICISKLDQWFR